VRPIRALLLWLALFAAAPAAAQSVPAIVSSGPDSVSVTIYRKGGGGGGTLDLGWLTGYARITETRTVHIPAGRSIIRFEGVAGGILPESAIIGGLPDGVLEKNLDADLLSSRTLFGRSFGRPVTLTHRNANGTLTSERAIIRSSPEGAAIFQTKDGFIAADCTGNESIVYDAVPEGLSARPTLSIETQSAEAREITLTLSYLSWGFDWRVNYVATMRPDGKTADLVAWATLASSDVTGLADAETVLVAGSPRRESEAGEDGVQPRPAGALAFQCLATHVDRVIALPPPPDSLNELPQSMSLKRNSDTVVDAISAEDIGMLPENFADYKLYRVPQRTNIASNSQKQVLLFDRPSVPVDIVFRTEVNRDDDIYEVEMVMRLNNREEHGLGIPLPGGEVALFEPLGERRLLVGEGPIQDRAVGEEIDIQMGAVEQVAAEWRPVPPRRGWEDRMLVVTNANPYPVHFEARIDYDDYDLEPAQRGKAPRIRADSRLRYKGRRGIWSVEIPANSSVTLRLRK
jgi:hypothetical protein